MCRGILLRHREDAIHTLLVSLVLFLCGVSAAAATPSITIHLAPASEGLCSVTGEDLRCDTINHFGDPSVPQLAYIVVSGFEGMTACRFGLGHDPGVRIGDWWPCIQGIEIPTEGWPTRSPSGVSVQWRHCLEPLGTDGLFVVGVVEIEPFSWGRLWIEAYRASTDDDAAIETCDKPVDIVPITGDAYLGDVRVQGVHPGRNTCQPRSRSATNPPD